MPERSRPVDNQRVRGGSKPAGERVTLRTSTDLTAAANNCVFEGRPAYTWRLVRRGRTRSASRDRCSQIEKFARYRQIIDRGSLSAKSRLETKRMDGESGLLYALENGERHAANA